MMHHVIIRASAVIAALALSGAVAMAADSKAPTPAETTGKVKPADQRAQAKSAKSKPARLVDINTAGKAELKTLPGIDDAQAEKIVAGRPYRSKADLVTRNIIAPGTYEALKRNVIAKPK